MGGVQYPTTTFTHSNVAALGTSSTTIVAANNKRLYLEIQNQGTSAIYLRLDGGTAVADSTAVQVLPGDEWWGFVLPVSAVTGISASGTNAVAVVEGN